MKIRERLGIRLDGGGIGFGDGSGGDRRGSAVKVRIILLQDANLSPSGAHQARTYTQK
jgi:hypothetical protein